MATNPFDKVYLSKSQLDTLANGGTITSGVDTYIADETALYLTDEKITEEDLDQSLQEKINAAGGFETLVGTTDTPINLVTDITLNKFYIISGNCSISDYAFIVENAHLCSKVPNSDIDGDALYIYNSSIIIPTEETETLKITDGTGTFLIGIESTGSPTIPSLVNAVNLFNGSAFSQHAVSFYAPTTAGTSGSFLQSNGEGAEPTWIFLYAPKKAGFQGQILQSRGEGEAPVWVDRTPKIFSNITVSNWVSDMTYSDFGYKADISITGLKDVDVCEVVFSQTDAASGNYAQVNLTSADTLTIYSKVNNEITIPTIIFIKGGI